MAVVEYAKTMDFGVLIREFFVSSITYTGHIQAELTQTEQNQVYGTATLAGQSE